jgi:hypothetical protein
MMPEDLLSFLKKPRSQVEGRQNALYEKDFADFLPFFLNLTSSSAYNEKLRFIYPLRLRVTKVYCGSISPQHPANLPAAAALPSDRFYVYKVRCNVYIQEVGVE